MPYLLTFLGTSQTFLVLTLNSISNNTVFAVKPFFLIRSKIITQERFLYSLIIDEA